MIYLSVVQQVYCMLVEYVSYPFIPVHNTIHIINEQPKKHIPEPRCELIDQLRQSFVIFIIQIIQIIRDR